MINLTSKVALITGSSQGIGLKIADTLAHLGCDIILNGRNQKKLLAAEKDLKNNHKSQIISIPADVSINNDVATLYNQALEKFGKVDIVVNNAGITKDNLILRMKEEDWDEVIKVNLKSAFLVSKYFSKQMLRLRKGRIINISSVVGEMGNSGQSNYSAAKAGLIGFSKSLARELAGKNITVNVVTPGYISTDMTENISETVKQSLFNLIPLKKFGESQDIANVVAFLASDLSDYITGQVLGVNGGMVM